MASGAGNAPIDAAIATSVGGEIVRPLIVNKRFAVRMSWTFLLLIGATVHQTSLQRWQSELAATQSRANQAKATEQDSRERVKSLSSESAIALEHDRGASCFDLL